MKKIIIEVPDDFEPNKNTRYACDWCINKTGCNANVFYCPIARGKEAIEWDTSNLVMTSKDGDIATMSNPKMNGKPVTLYAVEVEK